MLIIAVLFSAATFAQIQGGQALKLRKPISIPSVPINSARGTESIWLDYDSADAYAYGVANQYSIWNMNQRYSLALGDTAWSYCIVRFDSLYDVNTNTSIANNTVTNIAIDSIYAILGQENVSGTNDTLIVRIINLDASGYPGTTTLWADTMITDTSWSPAGNWLIATYLQWNPGITLPINSFAVELDYYGDRHDTCGFLAGYDQGPACGSMGFDIAEESNFYPNSYAYWMRPGYGLLPTSSGGDIFYNCTGGNGFQIGDGYDFIQDIKIGAWVTVNDTGSNPPPPTCGANFTIAADTVPHHYIVTNNSFGTGPLGYLWNWGDGTYDYIAYPTHTYADSGFYNICLTITDSIGCVSTYCDSDFHAMRTTDYMVYMTVVPPIVTGTKEVNVQTPQVTIYPNPAMDNLYINNNLSSGNGIITIYNVLGETIYTKESNSKLETVNCKPFPAGIYFVQVATDKERWAGRFVKE